MPTVERESLIRRADIEIPDFVAALDGLILQGGADIDPRAYGEEPTHTVGVPDGVRDRFELELLRGFAAAGKPVLGICRGMQLINVAYGGTLYQDLRADGATQALHVRREIYDEHVHGLRLAPGSALARCYGDHATARVNSIHHQGVKALGRAWSPRPGPRMGWSRRSGATAPASCSACSGIRNSTTSASRPCCRPTR